MIERALIDQQQGRLEAAKETCRAIIAKDPDNALALHLLGAVLLDSGRAAEAEQVIRLSLGTDANSAEGLHNLGLTQASQGRLPEAIHFFARAAAQRPGYVSAYYNLGLALQATGEAEKASAVYERVVALQPDHAKALNNLGILHHAKEELREASAFYRRALAADPGLDITRANLGAALLTLGERHDADAVFKETLKRKPRNPLANYILAQVDYTAGKIKDSTARLVLALDEMSVETGWLGHAAPGTGHVPSIDAESYREAFFAVTEQLNAANIRSGLLCGTLLGAIRDGDFIKHDKDIDLGIDGSVTPAMVDRALSGDSRFVRVSALTDDQILPAYHFKGRVAVDLFRLFSDGNSLWYGLHWRGQQVRWNHLHFGFRPYTFLGIPTEIPDDPERYLTECYEDWRTPNPHFAAWSSPNIDGGFPAVCRCLAYADIFKAAWSGARDRALSLCDQALALDPGDLLVARLRALMLMRTSGHVAPQGAVLRAFDDPFDNLS